MNCVRLDHFARFNPDGTIAKCGHMITPPGFVDFETMQSSQWLDTVRKTMERGEWPKECVRCQSTEQTAGHSVRLDSEKKHKILSRLRSDYLILGGVLDNICNSACQSCNQNFSTKIGSLYGKNFPMIDNQHLFDSIPTERIVELDINGGEPTASPKYQALLGDLPPNLKVLRVNTNGSRLLPNIEQILDKGIYVTITLSLDGVGDVHDYVRWPIKWERYLGTLESYKKLKDRFSNLDLQAWTTVHALNLKDFSNIQAVAKEFGLKHSWALLENPRQISIKYSNHLTIQAKEFLESDPVISGLFPDVAILENNQDELDRFIQDQDRLRDIDIRNFL